MVRVKLKAWMVPLLLLGTMAYCIAEEITLSSCSPFPRSASLLTRD